MRDVPDGLRHHPACLSSADLLPSPPPAGPLPTCLGHRESESPAPRLPLRLGTATRLSVAEAASGQHRDNPSRTNVPCDVTGAFSMTGLSALPLGILTAGKLPTCSCEGDAVP